MMNTHHTAGITAHKEETIKAWGSLRQFLQSNPRLRMGLLNNPLSGGNRKGLRKLQKVVAAVHPKVFQHEVQTPADVRSALVDFARQDVNIVVVNGGDGTVQAVLTTLFYHKPFELAPLLAILRSAGTTSMIAGDIGLKGSREDALKGLANWMRTPAGHATILQRRVLQVQVPSEKKPVYGMFFGAAGIYQASHFYHQKVHKVGLRGELGSGVTLARFLVAMLFRNNKVVSSVPISIGLNQRSGGQRNYFLVMITTLERLFLGLRPFWGTESNPLHFTAIGSRPQHLLRAIPSLIRGQRNHLMVPTNGYFSQNVDSVQMQMDSGFNLDGELHNLSHQKGPVIIRNGGQATFLQL